jgi:putative endonuclease
MVKETNNLGALGEEAAAEYLKEQGYKILDRNFQNNFGRRLGEIDIIARDIQEDELVFVEVKTRQYEKYRNTLPEENITYAKLRKLSKIAGAYLRLKRLEDAPYRFDAVSVWLSAGNEKTRVKHIKSL